MSQYEKTLRADEVRRLRKIADELNEIIDVRGEILPYLTVDTVVEFLRTQVEQYGEDDEKDELYHEMSKLISDLRARPMASVWPSRQ